MTMPDRIQITHQPRTMTPPDFRALCAELLQVWQIGDDIAGPMNRARAALKAEPEGEGPSLQWTDNMPPSEACRYDHCIAETPFGRFLITWKSWKEYDDPTVDETPWGDWYAAFNSVDEAKAACQQGMNERLTRCGTPATPPAPEVGGGTDHVEQLAAIIRKVDGNRSMGAAALAEAILERYPCAFLVDPLDTPPAPVPGEVGELVEWLNQVAQYLVDNGVTGAPHVQGAAILLEQQEAELAALRGVPVPVSERLRIMTAGLRLGYMAGHNDTVEGTYADPMDSP